MAIEGTLDEFRLPDILQMVAQQGKTGILTIQGEATIVAVSFLGGRVVSADSLEETVEDRLGEVLVREKKLTRESFAEVVERQRRGEGRLVDLLVDGGYLLRDEVLDSLRLQTTELLRQILSWERGEFKFYGNDEVSYEEGFQPISVEDLLLSALGEVEEPEAAAPPPAKEPAEEEAARAEQAAMGEVLEMPAPEPREPAERPPAARPRGEAGGTVEAFTPPAPAARPAPEEAGAPAAAARPRPRTAPAWLAPVLGLALAGALVAALLADPGAFLLPLPWQRGERAALQAVQRQTTYAAVDRAAKTFFLIENRFPDDLDRLVELSLLAPEDRFGPTGARLHLTPRDDSYELRPEAGEDQLEQVASVEAITGDFLLDPEFLDDTVGGSRQPLVLLD